MAVQPYGRCSVCSLELHQCHAWQSSAMSFALIVLILAPLFLHETWAVKIAVAGSLLLLVAQGMTNHKKTDDLIFGQHELAQARENLEGQVAARTETLRETDVALARANLELAELARRRERMVLEVSHDLRTPLTSVKGAAENLLDGIAGRLEEPQREYVEIVRDHAGRLIDAIGKLLDAARQPEPTVDLVLSTVDVGALARDVVRSLQPIAEERGVDLAVDADATIETRADREKVRKVMGNLVGNALKFTDRGGTVRILVSRSEGQVRVTVRDTGVGIDERDLAQVFDRFHRGRTEDRPGSGLGLAITRDLVRLHGGDVVATSQRGRGSTFSAVWPWSPEAQGKACVTAAPARSARLLVVDDDAAIRKIVRDRFKALGHEVAVAADGDEALGWLAANEADVVLLDLQMPKADGFEVLASLARRGDAPAVIVVTAHGSIEAAVRAVKAGATDFVTKPFDAAQLEHVVDEVLDRLGLKRRVSSLEQELSTRHSLVLGTSRAMAEAHETAMRAAASDATILLRGESGTGKEVVARAIHAASKRKAGPFMAVNCAALGADLLESELFGHEKGAFTGAVRGKPGRVELAAGGTLFLDEIGELAPALQAKLLRVLQEREFERVGGTRSILR